MDAAALALLALAGCTSIRETTQVRDVPVRTQSHLEPVDGTKGLAIGTRVHGTELDLSAKRTASCTLVETPVVHRTEIVKREGTSTMACAPGLGALSLLLGGYMYVDADGLAATPDSNGQTQTPDNYRTTGLVLGGVGLVGLAVGVVDVFRSRTSEYDRGEVELASTSSERRCPDQPLSGSVSLVLPSARSIPLVLDEAGHARVEMADLGVADVPASGQGLVLAIDDQRVPFSLPDDQAAALADGLLAKPQSRYAREEAELARKKLEDRLVRIRSTSQAFKVQLASARLDDAKQSVVQLASLGVDVSGEQKQLDDAVEASRTARCTGAKQAARKQLRSSESETVTQARAHLRAACRPDESELLAVESADDEDAAHLDDALTQSLDALSDKAAVREWEQFAQRCARIHRDQSALAHLRSCNAACESAAQKIQADADALEAAPLPDLPSSERAASQVRALCARSACPNCPPDEERTDP